MAEERGDREQRFHDRRRRLLDRLTVGEGVLCGLRLVGHPAGTLTLGPGVALDGLGREIVVDEPVAIDPHRLTDEEGYEVGKIAAGVVTIALAHRSPDGAFAVLVLRGVPEPPRGDHDLRELFAADGHAHYPTLFGRLARFLDAHEGGCFSEEGPSYVVLGRVKLEPGHAPRIEPTREAGRRLLVSNGMLLELLVGLWERVELLGSTGRPSPPPNWGLGAPQGSPPPHHTLLASAPLATPPPARVAPAPYSSRPAPAQGATALLQVVGVEFLDEWGRPLGALDRLIRPARFAAAQKVGTIQVTFSKPLDPATCKAIEPSAASILVRSDRGPGPDGHVPGTVSVQGNVARFQLDGGRAAFGAGEYEVTLFGDEDPAGLRPAIACRDRSRLDGEARTLPSGDGREGGNFVFRLRIGDD